MLDLDRVFDNDRPPGATLEPERDVLGGKARLASASLDRVAEWGVSVPKPWRWPGVPIPTPGETAKKRMLENAEGDNTLVPFGWTHSAWRGRLDYLAKLCRDVNPERSKELRGMVEELDT